MDDALQLLDTNNSLIVPDEGSNGLMMVLIISSLVSMLFLLIWLIVGAIGKHRERKAIIQTSQDVRAIRDLLERQTTPPAQPPVLIAQQPAATNLDGTPSHLPPEA